jgi:hypothetical protein
MIQDGAGVGLAFAFSLNINDCSRFQTPQLDWQLIFVDGLHGFTGYQSNLAR